ncbi:MAG TPA: bifunctional [glutamine synthetase] adenylyltransferase/[glutamine synthetase]-adenylyl-L-tyrosine phosphorylase [Trebonia sp.]|nr:bifunctional [glutamine synthetase] adenylyltransferase/[glutamine synthetase]-adenylyl-L-tyrosine phosphorylase [Trebonia sp.]
MSGSRTFSLTGWLARMGFPDAARAERMLTALGITGDEPLLSALAGAADPELALTGLAAIAERIGPGGTLHASLNADADFRERMVAVLGVSKVFADHLARHPADCYVLCGPGAALRPSAGQIRAELLAAAESVAALTAAYRRRVLHLAARDLTGAASVDEVTGELADIASAACEAALAIARAELPGDAPDASLAVVAMGKCGARELNYASDVDVIFVTDDNSNMRTATQLAAGMIRACELVTPEGYLFPVDPNLRPEGRDGALVRTLPSYLAYYDRWAKTWEFQALLKARPVAGDADLGERYQAAVGPLVWEAAQREHFVEDVQAMRRRVIDNIPKNLAGRELKLGPGGLRDIEFAVQLLQLVHGRTDESLRVPATLPALAALADGGYVGRDDADDLAESYRFLRRTEHLLQLYQLRRTHTLPEDPAVLRRLGRAMRLSDIHHGPALSPEEAFTAALRKHAIRVRRLHEKLFYRPLLDVVARLPSDAARLSPEAARARLEALGYADPAGALRHIGALTTGVRRRAAIQRTLLPVLLGWFADAAEPDAGLLAFRQVSEALGETPWYLRLLRDETKAAHRMATVLASSRYATGLLLRAPEAVAIFGDDAELVPKQAGQVRAEMEAASLRHTGSAESAAVAVRSLRRRELLRVAAADVLGITGLTETGAALTAITEASLGAVLAAAVAKVEMETRGPLPTRFAVLAMGRFGGRESGYGSDADVIFVHDPLPGSSSGPLSGPDGTPDRRASEAAQAVATELRRLLELPAPDPPLLIDADLRPEGRHGPLVPSLAACRAYYGRRAAPWEFQALLRARFAAGDDALGAEFLAMADPYRYPAGGLPETGVREIRRIKARVEAERIPRGADRALHVKLGPGGLSDVEWTVQLLQLRHGGTIAGLRTTRTLAALAAAVDAGLVSAEDAAVLSASWQLAARIRNAVTLISGRPGDQLPSRYGELTAVARLLGYETDAPAQSLEDDYRRTARHARTVMERLFYG